VGSLENIDFNIKLQFAHTLDDGFAGFLVGFDRE